MALKKSKTLSTGVTCEYWKIVRMNIFWLGNNVEVILAGYIDEQHRIDGKEHVDAYAVSYSGNDFNLDHTTNNTEKLYKKLKESKKEKVFDNETQQEIEVEQNFFADAIDC